MTSDEIKWAAFILEMRELEKRARDLLGMMANVDQDYQRFMAKVLKPLTREDL